MHPTAFDEETNVIFPPPGVDADVIPPLSVWMGRDAHNNNVTISCWKPTKEELEEIVRTGRVWLMMWTHECPPVCLSGEIPFEDGSDAQESS